MKYKACLFKSFYRRRRTGLDIYTLAFTPQSNQYFALLPRLAQSPSGATLVKRLRIEGQPPATSFDKSFSKLIRPPTWTGLNESTRIFTGQTLAGLRAHTRF